MSLTRRDFATLAAAAASLAPTLAHAEPPVPVIIAHRGASGERPEETRGAFDLAIDEGADFIEPDLVPTKEGILVARHENEISSTTDVAAHAEFADRKTTKTIDGKSVAGWFTEDFTLAELKTLTCRERLPQLRPQSAKFDGKEPILTFQEVIDIARAGCVRTARTVGVYPEMKHPSYFASIGLAVDERLAADLHTAGYTARASAVWVQCFETAALKNFGRLSHVRRAQLIDIEGGPADEASLRYADMISPDGLAAIRRYADAVAPHQGLVVDLQAAVFPAPTTLTLDAHAAGLQVHCWTARAENEFLPRTLQRGDPRAADFAARRGDYDKLMVGLLMTGVDGLFSDYPAFAARARDEAVRQIERRDEDARRRR
ncbi:MAG: glycerophosphodiester phosphodiesterase family protein [Caulobacterales bacterium]